MMQPVVSVAGAIFSPDRTSILLIERRDVPVWVLPGGGIDPQEDGETAIVREILEETGFTVKVTRLVGLYTPINRLAKATHLYECSIISGKPTPSKESRRVSFFPLENLPKRIPLPFKEWIQDAHRMGPPFQKALTSVTYGAFLTYLLQHPILVARFCFARLGIPINTNDQK